jgi:hypothetical protein
MTDLTIYKPISILPAPSKIFENAIVKRLNSYCIKNKINSKSQHGFRTKSILNPSIALEQIAILPLQHVIV